MKKGRIILIFALVIFLILLFFWLFNSKNDQAQKEVEVYTPSFLTDEQKAQFGLKPETKAQVFYDEEGNAIYKIIREDSDIVLDVSNYNY